MDYNDQDVRIIGYPHDQKPANADGSNFPTFWAAENRHRKSSIISTVDTFTTCKKCNRLLHESVVGPDGCYSCTR